MKGILQRYFKVLSVFLGGSGMIIHPDTWFQKLLGPGTFGMLLVRGRPVTTGKIAFLEDWILS